MNVSYRYRGEGGETVEVRVAPLDGTEDGYRITVGEQVFDLSARLLHRIGFLKEGGDITLQYEGREYHLSDARQQRRRSPSTAGDLRAPMAGKIIRIFIQPGDHVGVGDMLFILESMKMEQQVTAPLDGIVERVLCHEGEQVAAGTELVVLRAATG
jgi:acetyl/propionyl-CoA carboxylase alpha subunit